GKGCGDGLGVAAECITGGEWENALRSSFRDEHASRLPLHHDREPPPLEIERNLVDLAVIVRPGWTLIEDDLVERTPDTGLEAAGQIRKFQRAAGWIPEGIQGSIE